RLTLERLEAQGWDQRLRLLEPARVDLAEGLAVDRLRLGLSEGTLELSGRLLPPLATEARLVGLPLELAARVAPDLPLAGTLGGEIRLTGPIEAMAGSVRIQAEGLRLTQGNVRGLPPAEVRLAADLGTAGTRIDASAQAGDGTRLALRGGIGGRLPFTPGDLDLQVDGRLDLALLDPLLTGAGRQAAGQALLDARVTGSLTAPRLAGDARLTNGAFWDRTLGLVLTQAQGRVTLAGDTLRVEGLTAQAGTGRLALAGTVGALAPGIPVDLRFTAEDASPLQLDRLKVRGSGEVRLTGPALGRLEAAGTLRFKQVEIRLPERLPAAVVTLEVREVGQRRAGARPAPTGPGWRPDLGLDLLVSAPRSVEVRGRGVDAELGGEVRLQGTLSEPILSGGFDLRRGEYDLVGQTLRFSRGRLGFDGARGLNPSLDLEARVTAAGSTAILAVEGTAQAPRIALRGEPEMPQDEVLSRLLFGVAGGRLSPWQAARLGLAAASLAGIQVEGPGLLDRVRQGLGLGDLRLGSDAEGGTSLEGGRQLSERVYLGARQGTRAGEPQGVLRMEVSPRLRLEADVGPIGGTRAGAAFEIEY
ncbi:MAG: translocation/assembly module TamB domain-containing protein, partial [Bdellovibrio bacteriovorus]